ncbi:hypothetical protein J0910_30525 [Nocardiopsis sp. CNT-189]|uniref:hypothetical protein n=1 Tax=Nocardiopsis oceanisediminis TaxID=2816862 RepID=UPI003B318113
MADEPVTERGVLNGWVRSVAAEHDPEHQGHSTARLTTALTRQITAFTHAYFPADLGRARAAPPARSRPRHR